MVISEYKGRDIYFLYCSKFQTKKCHPPPKKKKMYHAYLSSVNIFPEANFLVYSIIQNCIFLFVTWQTKSQN